MKITIKTKKIKENLKKPNDDLVTKIIRIFIATKDDSDLKQLKFSLQKLNIDPFDAIQYLFPDVDGKQKISSKLMSKAVELHNSMCRDPEDRRPEREIKPDAFQNFPKVGADSTKVPIGNKEVGISDQEDIRKNKKNLKGGISENIYNVENFILNNLRFKLKNIQKFKDELQNYYSNNGLHTDLLDSLKDLYNDKKIPRSQAVEIFDIATRYKSEIDDKERSSSKEPVFPEDYPPSDEKDPNDKRAHLTLVKEKIIKFGIAPPFKRK